MGKYKRLWQTNYSIQWERKLYSDPFPKKGILSLYNSLLHRDKTQKTKTNERISFLYKKPKPLRKLNGFLYSFNTSAEAVLSGHWAGAKLQIFYEITYIISWFILHNKTCWK